MIKQAYETQAPAAIILSPLLTKGPWFIGARIDGEKSAGVTERDPVRIRSRFMDALAQKR